MSHTYPDPIQGPNSPLAKSFPYEPMPHYPTLLIPQISLRDYFAAAALQGLLCNGGGPSWDGDAKNAYQAADAMLKAREVKP